LHRDLGNEAGEKIEAGDGKPQIGVRVVFADCIDNIVDAGEAAPE
jgi:hypothetical protein